MSASVKSRINVLEKKLRELQAQKRLETFNDCLVFENDRAVIEKNVSCGYIFGVKDSTGKPRRKIEYHRDGTRFIDTNRISILAHSGRYVPNILIKELDEIIKSTEEARDYFSKYLSEIEDGETHD